MTLKCFGDFYDEGVRQKVKDAKKGNVAKLFYFLLFTHTRTVQCC